MDLPKAHANMPQERLGVIAVAKRMAELGQIWRETESEDVGLDGQIEFVNDQGQATGRLIAVQVKSGPSYLKDGGDHWVFYPSEKHRFYWEQFPIPVILMLHYPQNDATYWVDARQALRNPSSNDSKAIAVPKANLLGTVTPLQLFGAYGVSQEAVIESEELIELMISKDSQNPQFPLNYLELFAHGLTNICRSIFFNMDVACRVVETKLSTADSELGMAVGEDEHEFLFGFIKFLIAQHLAEVNFSDCLVDWYEREMQPSFLAPLTSRGLALVRAISDLEDQLHGNGQLAKRVPLRVAQEDFVRMEFTSSHYYRVELVDQFSRSLQKAGEEQSGNK